MKEFVSQSSFCEGCEFAGDIPADEYLTHRGSLEMQSGTEAIYFTDSAMRLSKGVTDKHDLENRPEPDDINIAISECTGPKCVLSEMGYTPVDFNTLQKRFILRQALNNLPGIKELGTIDFVTDDED